MLKWVEILKRVLDAYSVRTQDELGMALGAPVRIGIGDNAKNDVIPWPILERVVLEKGVSWDWLLTGAEHGETGGAKGAHAAAGAADPAVPQPQVPTPAADAAGPRPPVIETREFTRELLGPGPESRENDAPCPPQSEAMVRELRDIREQMQKEIDRVDSLLREES